MCLFFSFFFFIEIFFLVWYLGFFVCRHLSTPTVHSPPRLKGVTAATPLLETMTNSGSLLANSACLENISTAFSILLCWRLSCASVATAASHEESIRRASLQHRSAAPICFEEAIKHNPNDPDIYYHCGQGLYSRFLSSESAQV